MLPEVNKADMAGMMESIKNIPLAYMKRKTITVQIYNDYPKYATPVNKMITRM